MRCAGRIAATAAALVLLSAPDVSHAEDAPALSETPRDTQGGWWTPWYLADYGVIAAGAGAYAVGKRVEPRSDPLLGPRYDPEDPSEVFTSSSLDEPLRDESVPAGILGGVLGGVGVSIGGLEALSWAKGPGSAQHVHDALVGYAEAVAITAGSTSLLKVGIGRLRPDFGDRASIYHCSVEPEAHPEHCDSLPEGAAAVDREEAEDLIRYGRRSFVSGHASHAFSGLTYASLALGTHFVWGPDATPASRAGGIAAQAALLGTATYVAGSRVADGRHHLSDVLAGSALGLASANLAYWLRFHPDGTPRQGPGESASASLSIRAHPIGGASGLGLALSFEHP